MRILIADKLASFVAGRLSDLGAEVLLDPKLSGAELAARLAATEAEVLVVRSTQVTREHIDAAPRLALVVRAGAGVNTIDLATASARGVYVANCPGMNAAAVAELAIGHLVNLDRRIADNVIALREGRWDKKGFSVARGLRGRTLALLGFGRIGQEVARRAQGLGMRVVVWSRSLTVETALAHDVGYAATPEEAVRSADAVSVHLALTAETRGRIGRSVFDSMRHGAYFVNTSRGEVVDEEALLEALERRGLRAGLDVFANEPSAGNAQWTSPITTHPSVYGTHHIGASSDEAEEAVGAEVVRIVAAYRDAMPIPNCVNLAGRTPATHRIVVRHLDQVGVLAHVLAVLRESELNVQEMQNVVFSPPGAACARVGVVGAPPVEALARIGRHDAVLSVGVVPI
ncbi:MAG: hydroxyacid dehydrogenase [Deltaproteobacteria bacterium]|nr:hydroxyacid dehydrogenase [Deltaproteobacteria bacterium]